LHVVHHANHLKNRPTIAADHLAFDKGEPSLSSPKSYSFIQAIWLLGSPGQGISLPGVVEFFLRGHLGNVAVGSHYRSIDSAAA